MRRIYLILKTTEMRAVQGVASTSDGSLLCVNDRGKRSYNTEMRRIYVVFLLIVFLINLSLHLNRQSEQVDKAGSVSLVVNVIFAERCDFFGI